VEKGNGLCLGKYDYGSSDFKQGNSWESVFKKGSFYE